MANERFSEYAEESAKLYAQGLFEQSSEQKHALGTIRTLNDGRKFVYAKAGAVDLANGKIVQAPAPVANHTNRAVAAASVGDRQVTVTLGATAVAANAYKDGYLLINAGAGAGYAYKIKSHPSANASANLTVTLYDKLKEALSGTTSKATLVYCSYNGTIIHPSPPTAKLVGVPVIDVTAGYYFWAQCAGPCAVLIQGSATDGTTLGASATVDGAAAANAAVTQYVVGIMMQNGVDGEYGVVDLQIA
jgi:hypothetical protein